MNALLTRCRHVQVNWLDTHSCRCQNCGKTGHWFEREGLVMWVRSKKSETRSSLMPTNLPLLASLDLVPSVPSRAG